MKRALTIFALIVLALLSAVAGAVAVLAIKQRLWQSNNLTSIQLEVGQVSEPPPDATPPKKDVRDSGQTYVVKEGQDVYTVAVRLGKSPGDIRELNNLESPDLQVGQVLKIPLDSEVASMEIAVPRPKVHIVKEGEDLYTIAVRWGVSPSDMRTLNKLTSPDLKAGQVLAIPGR